MKGSTFSVTIQNAIGTQSFEHSRFRQWMRTFRFLSEHPLNMRLGGQKNVRDSVVKCRIWTPLTRIEPRLHFI